MAEQQEQNQDQPFAQEHPLWTMGASGLAGLIGKKVAPWAGGALLSLMFPEASIPMAIGRAALPWIGGLGGAAGAFGLLNMKPSDFGSQKAQTQNAEQTLQSIPMGGTGYYRPEMAQAINEKFKQLNQPQNMLFPIQTGMNKALFGASKSTAPQNVNKRQNRSAGLPTDATRYPGADTATVKDMMPGT